ncbi:hypothetical protein BN1221_04592 [Brenneria goodwinii]|uniref:Uncharacterized protein n=1 Tax=Brenneria goodwinii TaxID=1109412 RepID=A0A0G4K1M2_9GAMM|nr:hypothetical protein BN1221_04592 [Brenneria goodwinii]
MHLPHIRPAPFSSLFMVNCCLNPPTLPSRAANSLPAGRTLKSYWV